MELPATTPLAWPPFASPSMERIRVAFLTTEDVQDLPRIVVQPVSSL
jgi:hypothetical protein